MKKSILVLIFSLFIFSVFAQEAEEPSNVKAGWNVGGLPTITYNSDKGFQYGVLLNFFNYGDGTEYPKYLQNIYMEASQFTKGSAIYRLSFDSEYLIPGIRITTDLAYLPEKAFDFYGFNGFESKYNSTWEETFLKDDSGDIVRNESGFRVLNPDYKSRMFYRLQNNTFRFKTDIQIPFSDNRFLGLVGFNLQSYNISSVEIDRLNKGKLEFEELEKDSKKMPKLPDVATLYDEYVDWGIISEEEKDGGFIPLLKAGLVFDTRDNEPNPMKGMWTEAFIFGAPAFLGSESSFVKLNFTHRQYFTLIERDLSLAYRVGYQGTIAGETPFYYQTQIETSLMKDQLGLGGSKTIRGINRNRVVGDGFVYGNLELRWKAVHFNWINQNFYIGLNAYTDFGQVVSLIENDALNSLLEDDVYADYFSKDGEGLHMSYGAGLRIVMNENFIIAVDYGMAANEQDGTSGLYIGLNYMF